MDWIDELEQEANEAWKQYTNNGDRDGDGMRLLEIAKAAHNLEAWTRVKEQHEAAGNKEEWRGTYRTFLAVLRNALEGEVPGP